MRTVEIVKTNNGYFVTRRYAGQNNGREFFYTKAPEKVKTKKREFIKAQMAAKDKYIHDWTGE